MNDTNSQRNPQGLTGKTEHFPGDPHGGQPYPPQDPDLSSTTDAELQQQQKRAIRQAEQESEEVFRKLFHLHSAVMLTIDAETGRILDANQAALRFYGWSLEEMQNMHVQQINTLPPGTVRSEMMRAASLEKVRFEFRHRRADGSIRDVEVFSNSIENGGKKLLFSIIHDITERKHTEQILREEELYLRTILKTTADGFWEVGADGKITKVNHTYCRMSGYTRDELLKLHISNIDAAQTPAIILARIKRIIVQGSDIFETIHRRKDGTTFPLEISVTYLPADPGRFLCFCRDITDRRQAQLALQKKRDDLQTILDASPVMIFQKDCENRFTHVNNAVARFANMPKESIEGRSSFDFFPDRAEKYWQDDKEVIASGMAKKGIIEQIDTPAGRRWLRTDKIPCRDEHGRITGIIGFALDITENKQAEELLHNINRELEQRVEERTRELQETQIQYLHSEKLSAIGKLSASIAHEFNNPLQGIMSVLKGLKKRAVMEDEDRELLDAAIEESERIKQLIRSLQEFNRPSSCRKSVMDVRKAIDSLLLLYKSDFKSKRISLKIHHAENLPQIVAIPDQIKQVFLNLLANAADACLHPGGTITVTTWQEDGQVAVAVRDSGIGIEPAQMELIFQPFFSTKPAVKGTGLGLSVCHGIIKNHGGEIRVASTPGKGSTFTVHLPISTEKNE
jgi:PAS domain S-box-containing protein